jgi:transposase
MARFFREPDRRQRHLLPVDMMDWLPAGDIVHLIVDAVALMDLSGFEAAYKVGKAGQAPFAPRVLLALLIYAYAHGTRSSRAIERLCGRDAGFRFIVGSAVPDHTVIARFRRRHVDRMRAVFLAVLELCREAGLVRLGLVALDGTRVKADAALDANRTARRLEAEIARMLAEAEAVDAREDRRFGDRRGDELPEGLTGAAGPGSRRARKSWLGGPPRRPPASGRRSRPARRRSGRPAGASGGASRSRPTPPSTRTRWRTSPIPTAAS